MLNSDTTDLNNSKLLPEKPTIVIADDDQDILDALKMMLEYHNFHVETIADGTIIPRLKKIRPKLLLLDIYMSGTDGRVVCKELKSNIATRDIPVIMISASYELKKSTKQAGANDYLEKPFEMEDLLTKIGKYLPQSLMN